jgi:hypothetical protein
MTPMRRIATVPENRTRMRALAELTRLLPGLQAEVADGAVKQALDESLLREIFDIAWDHQFDSDRAQVSRVFRDVVREAVEGLTKES